MCFSGSGVGSIIEPIVAVPLNDELQQARVLVTRAEEDVLSRLTDKVQANLTKYYAFDSIMILIFYLTNHQSNYYLQMLAELDDIQNLLHTIVWLDVVSDS